MPKAISNTSPLLYLYRISALEWLQTLFSEVWVPTSVMRELEDGRRAGYDVPNPVAQAQWRIVNASAVPSEWLTLDLGPGELGAMALALEHPNEIALLDDALARRIAQAAGLTVWGTLRILLEAKSRGLVGRIAPLLVDLERSGMWLSEDVVRRILAIAGEDRK